MLQFVRVMAKGADCAENGPFFPTTPRNVIQNGIAIARDIVVMPDWVLIGAMLGSFALLMIILVIGLVSLVFFCSVPRNGFCVQTSFVMFRNCKVVGTKYLAYEVVFLCRFESICCELGLLSVSFL